MLHPAGDFGGFIQRHTEYFGEKAGQDIVPVDNQISSRFAFGCQNHRVARSVGDISLLLKQFQHTRYRRHSDAKFFGDLFGMGSEESMKVRYRAYVLKCKKEHRPILVGEKDFTDIKDMRSAIEFAHTPVGHAFVVKALLQGDLEVVNGKVIDHMGLAA